MVCGSAFILYHRRTIVRCPFSVRGVHFSLRRFPQQLLRGQGRGMGLCGWSPMPPPRPRLCDLPLGTCRNRQLEGISVVAQQFHETLEPLNEWLTTVEKRLANCEPIGTQASKLEEQIAQHKVRSRHCGSELWVSGPGAVSHVGVRCLCLRHHRAFRPIARAIFLFHLCLHFYLSILFVFPFFLF